MATQTAMPIAAPDLDGERPVMYSDGLPSLREMDSEERNIIYPPKTEKMPDGIEHATQFLKIVPLLRNALEMIGTTAFTLGDIFIYYLDEYGRRERVAPDALIALGVTREDTGEAESYFVELMGKPPDFVMEMASRSTHRVDLEAKPEIYAFIGIAEYWQLDPFGGRYYGFPLRGLRLVDGEYVEIEMEELPDGSLRGHSDVLGIDLYWMEGELRLRDPVAGRWLPLPTREDVEAAEARATEAEAQATEAEARATEAEAELAELREQLRQLREEN